MASCNYCDADISHKPKTAKYCDRQCLGNDFSRTRKGKLNVTHGHSGNDGLSEYQIHNKMKFRCLNKSSPSYPRYGARGITVCDRWNEGENGKTGYECFLEDMGFRPSKKHSLDRIDNDGNYEPGNCRWATRKQQQRNLSNTITVKINDTETPLKDLCEKYSLSYKGINSRIRRGWSMEKALLTPINPNMWKNRGVK